jgi:hypothetical protein
MRYVKAVFAFASVAGVLVMLTACSGVTIGTLPTQPTSNQNTEISGPPVVLSAQQLGQEGYDNPAGTVGKYRLSPLEVQGVVSSHIKPNSPLAPGPNDPIGGVAVKVQVNKKTGGTKDYNVVCDFKDPIKPGEASVADIAKGKTLTVRGRMAGTDQDSNTTINQCVIVNK